MQFLDSLSDPFHPIIPMRVRSPPFTHGLCPVGIVKERKKGSGQITHPIPRRVVRKEKTVVPFADQFLEPADWSRHDGYACGHCLGADKSEWLIPRWHDHDADGTQDAGQHPSVLHPTEREDGAAESTHQ